METETSGLTESFEDRGVDMPPHRPPLPTKDVKPNGDCTGTEGKISYVYWDNHKMPFSNSYRVLIKCLTCKRIVKGIYNDFSQKQK